MKIGTYKGYEIHYDAIRQKFYAEKNKERVMEAKTQEALQTNLDKLLKKMWKRLPVIRKIYKQRTQLGDVTSWVKDVRSYGSYIEVWYVYKKGEQSKRMKIGLNDLYEATPENLKLHEKIEALVTQRDALTKQITKLMEQMQSPLKWRFFELTGVRPDGR